MRNALLVALGGAVGSVARWLVAQAMAGGAAHLPWATLAVNLTGSFVLGLLLGAIPATQPSTLRLLLGTGFCGGFTTFSTYAVETVALVERGEEGRAAAYALGSVVLGLAAAAGGYALGRALLARGAAVR